MQLRRVHSLLLLCPLPASSYFSAHCLPALTTAVCVGTFQSQWFPERALQVYCMFRQTVAQRPACVGIYLHSFSVPSALLSILFAVGASISCSGRRDIPSSGLLSCLCKHTISICHRLGVKFIPCLCPLARDWTLVSGI